MLHSSNDQVYCMSTLWIRKRVEIRLDIREQEMPRLQTLWTQASILQKFPGEEEAEAEAEAEVCQQRHHRFDSC
ncbi:hypothetical protein RB195_026371 [Necator americanus]|uniref:Uncharacterized protein n=1 Tax=Necator americanus TaxID=51031 RepID=A0ABR1EWL2_NECAM